MTSPALCQATVTSDGPDCVLAGESRKKKWAAWTARLALVSGCDIFFFSFL